MTQVELLREHGVQVAEAGDTPHVREGYVGVVCPFCGRGSSNFGLGHNLDRKFWTCWKCGPKKTLDVLTELTGLSPRDVLRKLGPRAACDNHPTTERPVRTGALKLPSGDRRLLPIHRKYLKGRGFDPDELSRLWGVGGIGLHRTLAWRVFVPIHLAGEVVSWTTRTVGERSDRRYWSAAESEERVHHKHLLYGEDHCRHAVVVHEGPFDVWQTGYGAVCTFGTNYTKQQVLRLSRFPVRVVCFDSESKAQNQARKLCRELECFPGSTYRVELETGKDAASADPGEVESLRKRFLSG